MKKVFDNQDFFKPIEEALNQQESVSFLVQGTSMSPTFKHLHTEVFLKQKDRYLPQDVCLFKMKNKYFLHRLIKINNNRCFFRGDHLYRYEVCQVDQILAYVYQFKNGDRLMSVNQIRYMLKVRFYLIFKQVKMILRSVYRRVFGGHQSR